ncbi:MAG TPA: PIG-L family deacetylase [Acidimicrobiales bacterium]|nr:PIG-L family deacetylase [Acidimicrobiales bacterium]
MPFTVVSFHAHPDDEALLTAGTLARAAAEGHRVVLVTATDGAAGLAANDLTAGGGLAERRLEELHRAAEAIGCHDVRLLGYADSGMDGRSGPPGRSFATADVEEAAERLAGILTATDADVLTVYDPAGGYGHPDHIQVHRVGTRAARLAGTTVVLEATVDRRPLIRILRLLRGTGILRRVGVDPWEWSPERFERAFADPALITHCVSTRGYRGAKRAAMAAHASQSTADNGVRTLAAFLRLPRWVFDRLFSHEWFVEQGRSPQGRRLDDIFASLRTTTEGDVSPGAGPG